MKTHRPSNPDGATLTMRKTAPSEAMPLVDPLLSSQIGDFTVEERIGEGGMGVVYRATHSLIGKQAAIKVLRAELVSPRVHERLLVEARAVNAIRHPGIIDIFGFGKLPDGRPYIVMELLEGRPLSELMSDQKRLDVPTVLWMLDQILGALGAAHRAGVVHRDLKPANVFMVEPPSSSPTIKLVDFGIAKLLENRESPTTIDGSVLGTPEFMAPEQIRSGTVGPATDLYALGIMAFQMLTGVRPFQGDPVQVLFAQVDKVPPLPSSRAEGIPPELDTLLLQLLAKDPALRPPSAEAVQQQLLRVPTESRTQTFARPPGLKPKVPTQRPAPVPKPAVARVATRAPVAVVDAEDSGTETLKAIRRTPSLGWMLGGAALLVGMGAGAWWLSRPAPPVEAVPTQIAPTPPPQTEPTPPPQAEPHSSPEPPTAEVTTTPVPPTKQSPTEEPEESSPKIEDTGSPSPSHRKGVNAKRVSPWQPERESPPAVNSVLPAAPQAKSTVTDGIASNGGTSVVTPTATPPPPPKPDAPGVVLRRASKPELPREIDGQKRLADRLDRLFDKLHGRSPGGHPSKALLDGLLQLYQEAANARTATERTSVGQKVDAWQEIFNRELPPPTGPELVAIPAEEQRPVPTTGASPPSPAPPEPVPARLSTMSSAERLQLRLKQLTQEFQRRTAGSGDTLGLESQLQKLHDRAAQELTGTERTALLGELDKWEEQLKSRFPR